MERDIAAELNGRFYDSRDSIDLAEIAVVTDASNDEAERLGSNWVGTEHFVLGLFRLADDASLRVLIRHHVTSEVFKNRLAELLAPNRPF